MRLAGIVGAGNSSVIGSRSYRIDTVSPELTVASMDGEISGAVRDGSGVREVQVRVEPESGEPFWEFAALDGDQWSYPLPLQIIGPYSLSVETVDLAGNARGAGPFPFEGDTPRLFLPMIMTAVGGQTISFQSLYLPPIVVASLKSGQTFQSPGILTTPWHSRLRGAATESRSHRENESSSGQRR
ncbi:MAG: hypothetical protein GY759_09960 [Chloroflexi bacterium]|nr:hypothetical protein [Chloroflexota bacterium]